jgi:hypothetical protein
MAVATLPTAPMPSVAPMVAPMSAHSAAQGSGVSGSDGGSSSQPSIVVNFNIAGNADASTVASLERWVRDNGRLLHSVVKQADERDQRSNLK